jgi:hypothetical protein
VSSLNQGSKPPFSGNTRLRKLNPPPDLSGEKHLPHFDYTTGFRNRQSAGTAQVQNIAEAGRAFRDIRKFTNAKLTLCLNFEELTIQSVM